MKLTKKIIVAVLALAIAASCFVSAVFASDTQGAPGFSVDGVEGIKDIDDILEYYNCDQYIKETYDEELDAVYGDLSKYDAKDVWGDMYYNLPDRYFEIYDTNAYMGMYDHVTEIGTANNPIAEDDKVLMLNLGVDDYAKYARASDDGKAWTEKVFLTFDIYFDETCMSNSRFEVQTLLEGRALNTILNFDFGYGDTYYNEENPDITGPVVWYAPWDEDAKNFATKPIILENFSPKTNTWYSVTVCFNASDEKCSFEISDGEQNISVSYDIPGATGIAAFECKGIFSRYETQFWEYIDDPENPIHALMYLDDVEIYEGSYKRNLADKKEIAEKVLTKIEQIYKDENTSVAEKLQIADVFNELLSYTTDEAFILNYVPDARKYVNCEYVNDIISRVASIDSSKGYYDRVKYIDEEVTPYDEKIADGEITELEGVDAEKIAELNASRVKLKEEIDALAVIDENSKGFINAIKAYDPDNRVYEDIVAFYNEANSDAYKNRAIEYFVEEKIDETTVISMSVADAEVIFAELKAKYDDMVKDVADFVDFVEKFKATDPALTDIEGTKTFGARYTAYKTASIAYYKYDEMPEYKDGMINPDFDVVPVDADGNPIEGYEPSEAMIELRAAINYFLDNEAIVKADAALCDAFNMAVLKAYASDYFPTTEDLIKAADDAYAAIAERIEYFNDYKGIEVGKTIADTVVALGEVKNGKKDDKLAASALYIDAVNNIEGVEGFYALRDAVKAALALKAAGDNLAVEGVLDANMKLAGYEAIVNEKQGNSESVISLVAMLDSAKTISERRDLIREINKHVDGVANDFTGVTEAIATFEVFKAEFKADVDAANAALQSAIKNAVKF